MRTTKSNDSFLDSLADWRILFRAVQVGSIALAAKSCGLDASTVSRRIARLESALGTKLLHRTTHSLTLTPMGAVLVRRMKEIIADYDHLMTQSLEGIDETGKVNDVISISASPCFNQFVINNWALDFAKIYPGVRFQLAMTDQPLDPEMAGIDIAIHSGPVIRTVKNGVVLGQLTSTMAASPSYLAQYGTPRKPSDLQTHRLLRYDCDLSGKVFRLIKGNETETVDYPAVLSGTTTTSLIRAAINGKGLLLYACHFMLHEEFNNGRLVEVLPEWKQPLTHVVAICAPEEQRRPMVRLFLRYMLSVWCGTPGFLRVTDTQGNPLNNA